VLEKWIDVLRANKDTFPWAIPQDAKVLISKNFERSENIFQNLEEQ